MGKKRGFSISKKHLGIAIFIALIIHYVLPQAKITFLAPLAVFIYLFVGIYLLFF